MAAALPVSDDRKEVKDIHFVAKAHRPVSVNVMWSVLALTREFICSLLQGFHLPQSLLCVMSQLWDMGGAWRPMGHIHL